MACVTFTKTAFTYRERTAIRGAAARLPDGWRVIVGDPASCLLDVTVFGPGFVTVKGLLDLAAQGVVRFIESLQPAVGEAH